MLFFLQSSSPVLFVLDGKKSFLATSLFLQLLVVISWRLLSSVGGVTVNVHKILQLLNPHVQLTLQSTSHSVLVLQVISLEYLLTDKSHF